jgi:predicted RNA-binding Zn-ribbon protein involved in translation (DUF1610 family)
MALGEVASSLSAQQNAIGHFPCDSCSAGMKYDPATGMMKCPFCGTTKEIASPVSSSNLPKHPLFTTIDEVHSGRIHPITDGALEVHCDSCGSTVAFDPPEIAGLCPFCGLALVAQAKSADPVLVPDAVLPVQISKEQAQAAVRQWLRTRWFAPNSLKRLANQEAIQGVYLPFWSYDAVTLSKYVGERGEHYYVTESYTETDSNGNSVQKSRQVQHTSWSSASGHVTLSFSDMLVAASRSVEERKLKALDPWALEKLHAYDAAYLAGFKAQRYQVELSDGFKEAQQTMARSIDRAVRSDIGGDEQRITSVKTDFLKAAFQQLLLPVWIGAYRFKGTAYQVVVNASTGEVQGERPYGAFKIAALAAVILIAIYSGLYFYSENNKQSAVPIEQPTPVPAAPVEVPPSPPPAPVTEPIKHKSRHHHGSGNHSSRTPNHRKVQPTPEE